MKKAGLLALAIMLPVFVGAVTLININTANSAQLETLSGIGPSKAAAIITYRTQHGPFAKIEDIQNVSGIGPSTYAGIKAFITVGETSVPEVPASPPATTTASITSTSTVQITTSQNSGSPEYLIAPVLKIVTSEYKVVSSGADTAFTAVVYDGKRNKRDDSIVSWSFGDGMRKIGASVFHTYYDAGEYVAIVRASTQDGGNALSEVIVTVKDASIKISLISTRGISVVNDGSRTLDLSLWRLSMGGQEFKIPEDTQILAGRTILFPTQVIELPIASSASLLYPSGEIAAIYPPQMKDLRGLSSAQPSEPLASLNIVKQVEPIISQRTNVQTHAETVIAPSAVSATETAEGAALPVTPKKSGSILNSPWTLGLLGIIALAGSAFIFL